MFEPLVDLDDALLGEIVATGREIARLQARQLAGVARFAACRPAVAGAAPAAGFEATPAVSEFAGHEVAAALGVSPVSGRNLVHLALSLTHRLPGTLAGLASGDLDLARARVMADVTIGLPDAACAEVETQVLRRAADQTPGQLRRSAERAALRVDPRGAEGRHRDARAERRLAREALPDGMAELRAITTAEQVAAVWQVVDQSARRPTGPDDDRTLDARRADSLVGLVLDGLVVDGQVPAAARPGVGEGADVHEAPRVRAEIRVVVPLDVLTGASDGPAELLGHGPIPASSAREIAFRAGGVWRRLVTDPQGETVLDVGTSTYAPPRPLARFVRARDGTCRFPGCLRAAETSDLDHTVEFPRGSTSADNLVVLCRHHHRLKHESPWSYRRVDGVVEWRSPTGRVYDVASDHTTG